MKHFIFCLTTVIVCSALIACSSETGKESKQQEQIEQQIKSDEAKMDSMERAIQEQMKNIPDDSILNDAVNP